MKRNVQIFGFNRLEVQLLGLHLHVLWYSNNILANIELSSKF